MTRRDLASCWLDGGFLLPVRRPNPPDCEAPRQPHSPVGYLVERVRATAPTGDSRHHAHPIRARREPARPGPTRHPQRAAAAAQPGLPAAGPPCPWRGSPAGGVTPPVPPP